jgi:hypothetical protein
MREPTDITVDAVDSIDAELLGDFYKHGGVQTEIRRIDMSQRIENHRRKRTHGSNLCEERTATF